MKKKIAFLGWVCLAMMVLVGRAEAREIKVCPPGVSGCDYNTNNINEAIAVAGDGDTINVAYVGSYRGIDLSSLPAGVKKLTIDAGTWVVDEGQRAFQMEGKEGVTVTIKGADFRVKNPGEAAIYIPESNRNCKLFLEGVELTDMATIASVSGADSGGPGIFIGGNNELIARDLRLQNSGGPSVEAVGMVKVKIEGGYFYGGSVQAILVRENVSLEVRGVIFSANAKKVFDDGTMASVVDIRSSQPFLIKNCLFYQNDHDLIVIGDKSSAATVKGRVINNTFLADDSTRYTEAAVRWFTVSPEYEVINNIFVNNFDRISYGTRGVPGGGGSCGAKLKYNLFLKIDKEEGETYKDLPMSCGYGEGDIKGNPLFVSTTGMWDHHLAAGSPAINAGDPTILDEDGSRSDMGAYGGTEACFLEGDCPLNKFVLKTEGVLGGVGKQRQAKIILRKNGGVLRDSGWLTTVSKEGGLFEGRLESSFEEGFYEVCIFGWAHLGKKWQRKEISGVESEIDFTDGLLKGGDANRDNKVNGLDAIVLLAGGEAMDLNLDGTVDKKDVAYVGGNYAQTGESCL